MDRYSTTTGTMARPPSFPTPLPSMRYDALWTDLDSGINIWDNIPAIVRQSFRQLLAMMDETNNRSKFITTEMTEQFKQVDIRCKQIEDRQSQTERNYQVIQSQIQDIRKYVHTTG